MNSPASDYNLQNAILKEMAKPSSAGSHINIEKPMTDAAATEANAAAQDVIASQRMAQNQKQFLARLFFAKDQLSTWSKQNDLATLISAAAIPAQVIGAKKQMDSVDRQNTLIADLIKGNAANAQAATDAAAERTAEFENRMTPADVSTVVDDHAMTLRNAAAPFRRPVNKGGL